MKNIATVLLTLVFTSPTLAKDTLEVQKTQPAVTNESTCPQPSAASKDNIDIDTLGMPISYDFTLEKKKRISLSNVIISINSEVDTGVYMFWLHLNNIARDHYGLDINYFSGSVCVYDIFKNELIYNIELEGGSEIYGTNYNKFNKYGEGIGFHLNLNKKAQYLIVPIIYTKIKSTSSYTFSIEKKSFVKWIK